MVCYYPNWAARRSDGTIHFLGSKDLYSPETGELIHVGNIQSDSPLFKLPCGQCMGCRLDRSRQWAIRCIHEASLHKDNCFITLTYSPEHCPDDMSLRIEDFQKFMKRLRKRYGEGIRFFHCGEYGSLTARPHYHAILFNFDFLDKIPFSKRLGNMTYVSQSLSELWPFGHHLIGDCTFESAAYVARYIIKKINGGDADEHYSRLDPSGNIYTIQPEYTTMSRRPGIGSDWFDKYSSDVFPKDYITHKGKRYKAPRFYDEMLKKKCGQALIDAVSSEFEILDRPLTQYETVKKNRLESLKKNLDNNTPLRLKTREIVQSQSLKRLVRGL